MPKDSVSPRPARNEEEGVGKAALLFALDAALSRNQPGEALSTEGRNGGSTAAKQLPGDYSVLFCFWARARGWQRAKRFMRVNGAECPSTAKSGGVQLLRVSGGEVRSSVLPLRCLGLRVRHEVAADCWLAGAGRLESGGSFLVGVWENIRT